MTAEQQSNKQQIRKPKVIYKSGTSDAMYGFGLIGAWVYYLGHATTFWLGMSGILKGIFWPAMLVYELLKYLNM
jgi:hypothetical protein